MSSRVISQKVAVSVVYAGAMFIAVMDQTIVNLALAAIGRMFHTPATAVAGTVIGCQVSVAVFIPAAAWLGDRIGPRQLLLGSIAVFTVASALCGLAGSLDGVSEGPNAAWTDGPIVASIAAGTVLLAAMVVIEPRAAPLLDLRVYAGVRRHHLLAAHQPAAAGHFVRHGVRCRRGVPSQPGGGALPPSPPRHRR